MISQRKTIVTIVSLILFQLVTSGRIQAQWIELDNWSKAEGEALDACNTQTAVLSRGESLFKTVDGGGNWMELPQPADEGFFTVDLSVIDDSHFWIAGFRGKEARIYATGDGGMTWTVQFSDTTKTEFLNYVEMFDENLGVAMGDGKIPGQSPAVILKTNDGGNHWESVNESAFASSSGDVWRRIDFVNPGTGYFYGAGGDSQKLYKTTNGGSTWSPTNFPDNKLIQVLKFFDPDIGLAIHWSGKLYRTLDGGESWDLIESPHQGWGNDIEFAPDDPARVWMTDNQKVYFSSDTGRTWIEQFPTGGRDLAMLDSQNGWLLGDYGVFKTSNGGVTSVRAGHSKKPESFVLYQNYPNPFNPATMIRFDLPKASFVVLKIHDILGREVETLVHRTMAAGAHEFAWRPNQLASGVYFYQLKVGDWSQIRRLILKK